MTEMELFLVRERVRSQRIGSYDGTMLGLCGYALRA